MKNHHHHHSDAHHTPLPPRCIKWPQNRDNNKEGNEGWETMAGARDTDVSRVPGKFFYYFIHFLNYTNVLQVPQWRTATMTLATHHSHLTASNNPKTETTTKKAMRVGRWGQGLEMQTCLKPQVSFFTILYIFKTTLMFYRYHNNEEPPPPPPWCSLCLMKEQMGIGEMKAGALFIY